MMLPSGRLVPQRSADAGTHTMANMLEMFLNTAPCELTADWSSITQGFSLFIIAHKPDHLPCIAKSMNVLKHVFADVTFSTISHRSMVTRMFCGGVAA